MIILKSWNINTYSNLNNYIIKSTYNIKRNWSQCSDLSVFSFLKSQRRNHWSHWFIVMKEPCFVLHLATYSKLLPFSFLMKWTPTIQTQKHQLFYFLSKVKSTACYLKHLQMGLQSLMLNYFSFDCWCLPSYQN